MNKHPKGTLEYYRSIFMADGLREMVSELTAIMREAGNEIVPNRLDNFIKAILYGCNSDGTVRIRPPEPNFEDIKNNYSKFKFEKKVFETWVSLRNQNRGDLREAI